MTENGETKVIRDVAITFSNGDVIYQEVELELAKFSGMFVAGWDGEFRGIGETEYLTEIKALENWFEKLIKKPGMIEYAGQVYINTQIVKVELKHQDRL